MLSILTMSSALGVIISAESPTVLRQVHIRYSRLQVRIRPMICSNKNFFSDVRLLRKVGDSMSTDRLQGWWFFGRGGRILRLSLNPFGWPSFSWCHFHIIAAHRVRRPLRIEFESSLSSLLLAFIPSVSSVLQLEVCNLFSCHSNIAIDSNCPENLVPD